MTASHAARRQTPSAVMHSASSTEIACILQLVIDATEAISDNLDVVSESSSPDSAALLVARAAAAKDPQLSELLFAQDRVMREGSPENRARVRELLTLADSQPPNRRPQFTLTGKGVFNDNLTLLEDEDGAIAWIYDDDIVSLDDIDPGGDPWEFNVNAQRHLRELFASPRASAVRSVRLCLFGGTQTTASTLREIDAASRITHLDVRTQKKGEAHVPIAFAFPMLRGLTCDVKELGELLGEGAPELRSLVTRGDGWRSHLADLASRAPKLHHLGIFHSAMQPADLETLAKETACDQLTSLEIFFTNYATRFPFDALLSTRDAWKNVRNIYLSGHLVPPDVQARFEDWPEVSFVTWDRREAMARDFQTMGWAADAR